jgi:hypothetical protein
MALTLAKTNSLQQSIEEQLIFEMTTVPAYLIRCLLAICQIWFSTKHRAELSKPDIHGKVDVPGA